MSSLFSHGPAIPRRTFLGYSLAAVAGSVVSRSGAQDVPSSSIAARLIPAIPAVNAFSRLKKKLSEGKPATMLIISDSTGYLETSGTRLFIRWLATQFPAQHTTERYWAEWVTSAPTGPRNYREEPMILGEGGGASAPGLTILNAVLPGAFAQAFVDGSRWSNMLAPLKGQAPDLILWNHGHNHQAAIAEKHFAYGRGSLLAPIGRVGLEFPEAPQAAIIQNPWRDNDGYARVRDWWVSAGESMPALTLIDGYTPFLERKKSAELYKDNVHPAGPGYELIHQQLVACWEKTVAQDDKAVPVGTWASRTAAEPLVANGDLREWSGDLPKNWRLINAAVARKDTDHVVGGASWSLALTGTKQNDGLQLSITGAALARVRGKSVSIAVLCYVPQEADQDIQVKFTTSSTDQVTGSIQFARDNWKWIVMSGCEVPVAASLAFVGIYRTFAKPPANEVPFYIQRVVVTEGDAPMGNVAV